MRPMLPLVVLLAGCVADGSDAVPPLDTVMTQLSFARAEDGVSRGFDLDGFESEAGGNTGCGHDDYLTPDGSGGVDNQIARLLPILDDTEARALEPTIQTAVNDGEILLMVEFRGLDDLVNDDEVEVVFLRGGGRPSIGNDGFIEPGQTFDKRTDTPPVVVLDATVVDGVLTARGFESIDIPIDIFSAEFTLSVQQASLRFEFGDNGEWGGFFAGAFPYQPVLDGLLDAAIDQGLKDLLPGVFEGFSDIDGPNGFCSSMSVTLDFQARAAFFFEDDSA